MSDTLARRLTVRIAEVSKRTYDRQFVYELDELLLAPKFTEGWGRFVDEETWPYLDKAARLAAYLTALKAHHDTTTRPEPVSPNPPYHGYGG